MGQYYKPILQLNNHITIYNRDIDGEYTLAKLMEHSWFNNPLMKAISEKLYENKGKLLWCGDYAEDEEIQMTNLTISDIWDNEGKGLKSVDFNIDNLFLCNHETKQYIDINKYKKESTDKDGMCIHPLSLLTAVGNGRGGGDYWEDNPNADKVGLWVWQEISFEKEKPIGYSEFEIVFKEV